MSAPRLASLLACLLLVTAFAAPATALASAAASAASGQARTQPPKARAAKRRTVSSALAALAGSGAINAAEYKRYASAYSAARRSYGRISGTRRAELGAVLANVQAMAAAGLLTATRAPAVFLTLERNRQWWTTEPLLGSGERVSFPHSKLVWEYYPSQGIEIQWLGTFGSGNGYFLSGHENNNLKQLLSEFIPLATKRAGGIAWEYLFQFDGGQPPWTSGLSQGTGLQVLARAYQRFKDPAYLTAAQQALGIFTQRPPVGVRVKTAAGAHYAEYTYAPADRILNGFIQALVGIYDYTQITGDPLGSKLFEAGDAEARAEVPHYDTGAWSLYDQFGESNLNYHELLTEFLQHLCDRTKKGPPAPSASAPATSTAPGGPTSGTTGGSPPAGAHAAATGTTTSGATGPAPPNAAAPTPPPAGIPGDEIYCTTAKRFKADLSTPPAVALLTHRLATSSRAGVTVSLSKISTVRLTVRQGGKVVWTNSATVGGGRPKLLWVTPSRPGNFEIGLTATDLAGNFSTASGTIALHKR